MAEENLDSDSAPSTAASLKQRAVRGGAILVIARLVAQVFQWSITLFVARWLAPEDYGMMTSGTLFLVLADLFAEAGIGRALVQKKELTREDLAQGFTLTFILSAALYSVLFLLADPAADFLGNPDFATFLRVLALALFLTPWRSTAGAALERNLQLGKSSSMQLAAAFVQAVIVFSLAYTGFGYWALAAGALIGRAVETVLLCMAVGWRFRLAWPSRESAGLLRYGLQISASSLCWYSYSNSDFAAIGALLSAEALGYYSLAFQLISLPVQKISATANQIMFAVYCRMQDDPDRLRDWFLRLTVLQNFVAMPALAGMGLVASDGIPALLGEKWSAAVLPLQLLCPVGAIMMIATPLPPLFNAIGRPDINAKYSGTCAVFFPASFFGVGWLGHELDGARGCIIAVCLVWLVLYPIIVAGLITLTTHLTRVNLLDLFRANLLVTAGVALMIGAVLAVQWTLADTSRTARLGASIAAGAVTYATWMLATARGTILADILALWRELRPKPSPQAPDS